MRILFIIILLLTFSAVAQAKEVLLKVTPTSGFTTSRGDIFEGGKVQFRVVEDAGEFKADTVLTGTIMEYEPNNFSVREARIVIGNFTDGTRNIKGNLYLNGNPHFNFEEVSQGSGLDFPIIRGGEIVAKNNSGTFFAEYGGKPDKLPIRITPVQRISTAKNETQVGDAVKFKTVDGVPVVGIVDYVNDNGWWCDSAHIDFKTFKMNGRTFESSLSINGLEILKYKGNRPAQFFNYAGIALRGKEIEIIPEQDDMRFTIWLTP